GVAQSLIDIASRMAAAKTFYLNLKPEVLLGSILFLVPEVGPGAFPSGTADVDLALFLRIQVQQDVPGDKTGFQRVGTGQAGFLVHGKQRFDLSVSDIG